jgi:hypothetical protein
MSNLLLPPGFDSKEKYIEEAIDFLHSYQWLTGIHCYDTVAQQFYQNEFPENWRFLSSDESFDIDTLIDMAVNGTMNVYIHT